MKKQLSPPTVKLVGGTRITYSLTAGHDSYDLAVCSDAPPEQVLVKDIARDLDTAERIKNIFADNLVFPANVYEVFDDLLGT